MTLTTGQEAPMFTGNDQKGQPVSLQDFKGKKVVLYFYPKDNTPGCTDQACNLRDNYSALLKAGYVILGISTNNEKSHQKFSQKFELPFPLIADADRKITEAYGLWVEKSMFGKAYMGTARTTIVLDEKGIITRIIDKVKTKEHAAQILE